MFGLVGDENPVVIDSLWKSFPDFGRDCDEEEPDKIEVNIDVDTSKLDAETVNTLINRFEEISYESKDLDGEITFEIDYDLDENRDVEGNEAPIVLIQLRGYCLTT